MILRNLGSDLATEVSRPWLCHREQDRENAILLLLLDSSLAFDTIDHGILQDWLWKMGIRGVLYYGGSNPTFGAEFRE